MAVSERTFRAAPEAVFDCLVDAESYPSWLVGAKEVHVQDPSWPEPGSSFEHRVGAGPVEVHDETSVKGVVPGRALDLIVRARPLFEADVHFDVYPEGTGTRLRMKETPRGPFRLLAPLIAPLVKLRNDRSLSRLADRLDGSTTTRGSSA
jgi:uncharacterized protein YndB with AHSA1/START domain